MWFDYIRINLLDLKYLPNIILYVHLYYSFMICMMRMHTWT